MYLIEEITVRLYNGLSWSAQDSPGDKPLKSLTICTRHVILYCFACEELSNLYSETCL